jgi:hypothetical protein
MSKDAHCAKAAKVAGDHGVVVAANERQKGKAK